MKHLILLGILCLSTVFCKAQHSIVNFTNTTSCDVFIELWGDVASSSCSTVNYSSELLLIPAMSTFFYDPSTVPNGMNCSGCTPPVLGPADIFWHCVVYKSPSAPPFTCIPATTFQLEDNGCNINTTTTYAAQNSSCAPCGGADVIVDWVNAVTQIDINIHY